MTEKTLNISMQEAITLIYGCVATVRDYNRGIVSKSMYDDAYGIWIKLQKLIDEWIEELQNEENSRESCETGD